MTSISARIANPVGMPLISIFANKFRQEFLSIYPNRHQYICREPGDSWKKRFRLATYLIDAAISAESDTFYGAYWGDETRFAVLDIDKNSQYHNAQELRRLRSNLADIGLPGNMLFQSSESTGWHLYIPFFTPAPSKEVEQALKAILKANGYDLTCGVLEVFPSGNALRLPLQAGWAWLDANGEVIVRREELNVDEAISRFLSDFNRCSNDWTIAKAKIESQLEAIRSDAIINAQAHREAIDLEGFDHLYKSCKSQDRIEEAHYYLDNGLTERGQRHDAIYAIQHLLWFGDKSRDVPRLPGSFNNEKRFQFLLKWLENNHNSYSSQVNRGAWRFLEGHARRAVEWRRHNQPTFEYQPYMDTERQQDALIGLTRKTGYLWTPEDLARANQKRGDLAREKILEAVQVLKVQGRRVTGRAIMRLTCCSYHTVKRHSDIWKILPVVALPRAAGDLDPGVVGGLAAQGGSCSEEEIFKSEIVLGDSRQTELSPDFSFPEHAEDVDEAGDFSVQSDMLEQALCRPAVLAGGNEILFAHRCPLPVILSASLSKNRSRAASDAVLVLSAYRQNIQVIRFAYFENIRKRPRLWGLRAARGPPIGLSLQLFFDKRTTRAVVRTRAAEASPVATNSSKVTV